MGNRVEDLEKQVAELQATIDGLTEELVETKERVRQLEDDGDTAPSVTPTPSTEADGGDESRRENQHAEFVPNADRSEDVTPDEPAAEESGGWREAGEEEPADGTAADAAADDDVKSEDGQESNEDGDAEDDGDIIVA